MFKKMTVILVTLMFFVGCASMGQLNPTTSLTTPKARARFVMVTYIGAYNDYIRFSAIPNLRDEAKDMLNKKRKLLLNVNDPIVGIPFYVNLVETGQPLTDAAFNALLDKLTLLEMDWYVNDKQYTSENPTRFVLTPQQALGNALPEQKTDENLRRGIIGASSNARLISIKKGEKISGVLVGGLIELIRLGIHAYQALLTQQNLTPEQLEAKYQEALIAYRALDMSKLAVELITDN